MGLYFVEGQLLLVSGSERKPWWTRTIRVLKENTTLSEVGRLYPEQTITVPISI